MTRCPFCFTSLGESLETAFICVGSCPERPDEAASRVAGMPVPLKTVTTVGPDTSRRKPAPAKGVRCTCGTPTSWEVCRHCHYSFPEGWRDVTTTCLAFAGARATGKSIYIGVLRQQAELFVESWAGR